MVTCGPLTNQKRRNQVKRCEYEIMNDCEIFAFTNSAHGSVKFACWEESITYIILYNPEQQSHLFDVLARRTPRLNYALFVKGIFVCIMESVDREVSIEGFHDAVRTPYALRPGRHVGFFWNNKICFNFVSILFEMIKLTVSERTYIIVPMV